MSIIDGTASNDTLNGTDGGDIIDGGAGNDSIHGGAGNDIISSGPGNDDIWGGQGNDFITGNSAGGVWAWYDEDPAAVNVNLVSGGAIDGWGTRDTLSQVYGAVGSDFNDTLSGLGGTNSLVFYGGNGDDKITGGWGNDLLSGGSGNDVIDGGDGVAGLSNSAYGSVFRLYQATLGRDPDVGGFQEWAKAVRGGMSLQTAAGSFVGSAEFQASYGSLSNTQFVTLLYSNVLGRSPDAAGLSAWVTSLDAGNSRANVVTGFSESTEFKNNTSLDVDAYLTSKYSAEHQGEVYRMYRATLGRDPDSTGFLNWMNALDGQAQSIKTVAAGFVGSTEFQNTYGALNNSQFTTLLYNNVLGRAPDAAGLAAWVNALDHGVSRADVVVGFSDSVEFRNNTSAAQTTYIASSFGSWKDTLAGGSGGNTLIGGRGADEFLFQSGSPGNDQVYGLETVDQLRFSGFNYGSVADVMNHMTQNGQNVVFSDGAQNITFHHTTVAQVGQTSILLGA